MPFLTAENLCVRYNGHNVLNTVELCVETGERWAVIGRNGAGKSTLVKTIAGLLRSHRGVVKVADKNVSDYRARDRARYIAYVPQKIESAVPYTVSDFVMLGRYAAMGLFGLPDTADKEAVTQALEFCDVSGLQGRMMNTLSGGEVQRVLLAGALAQEAKLLLLDEPTTFLDPAHERLFFRALENAHQHREMTIIMVTHDINTALSSCTHVLALLHGATHFCGTVKEFRKQCPDVLETLYGIGFVPYRNDKGSTPVYGTWEQTV